MSCAHVSSFEGGCKGENPNSKSRFFRQAELNNAVYTRTSKVLCGHFGCKKRLQIFLPSAIWKKRAFSHKRELRSGGKLRGLRSGLTAPRAPPEPSERRPRHLCPRVAGVLPASNVCSRMDASGHQSSSLRPNAIAKSSQPHATADSTAGAQSSSPISSGSTMPASTISSTRP